jgi:hypothetical protein
MTQTAHTDIGSNSKDKMADFQGKIKDIQVLVAKGEKALKGHHTRVHQALVATYQLGLDLIEADLLLLFIGTMVSKIGSRQQSNDFHELVSIAFNGARDDSKSKYRKVLKYAQTEKWSVDHMQAFFDDNNSLAELYDKAVDAGKASGDTRREDRYSEKISEAKAVLKQKSLGSVTGLKLAEMQPHLVDGYANAVVRQINGGAEIVGFVPASSKIAFERMLVELVPTIADRLDKKLSSKKLYRFFVICDVFTRLLPKKPEILEQLNAQAAMQQDLVSDPNASKEQVLDALKSRQEGTAAKGVTVNDVTSAKNVLWLTKQDGDAKTRVQSGTSLPSMIGIEAELDWKQFKQIGRELRIAAVDTTNFTKAFLRQLEWNDEHTSQLSHVTANDNPPTQFGFANISAGKVGFRVLKDGGDLVHNFHTSKGTVLELAGWREDFRKAKPKTSKRSFPKQLRLKAEADFLWVTFPDNLHEKRQFGKITNGASDPVEINSEWLVDSRLFDRVMSLAADYAITYEGRLLTIAGAPYAIEFSCSLPTGPCKLTMPLSVGLAGGLIENTDMFVQPAALPAPAIEQDER